MHLAFFLFDLGRLASLSVNQWLELAWMRCLREFFEVDGVIIKPL